MPRRGWNDVSRPERTAGGGAAHYTDHESSRYTSAAAHIQTDLSHKALELLGIQAGETPLVLDLGCGSGLSGRVLTARGLQWIGSDISLPMLNLAASFFWGGGGGTTATVCQGRVAAADMTHSMPLRSLAIDYVISISAVQWVCVAPHPSAAATTLFSELWRCLRPGGRAALQVYLENDAQRELLLGAALHAGFHAGYFLDFPHSTPAKKFYILLYKSPGGPQLLSSPCCALAWPATACCTQRWIDLWQENCPQSLDISSLTVSKEERTAGDANDIAPPGASTMENSKERLWREHAALAKRLLRLLRRAAGGGPSPTFLGGMESLEASITAVEAAAVQRQLMPCGSPVLVHLWLPEGDETAAAMDQGTRAYNLASKGNGNAKTSRQRRLVELILGLGSAEPTDALSTEERKSSLTYSEREVPAINESTATWRESLSSEAIAVAAAAHGSSFFSLESLPGEEGRMAENEGCAPVAILRAQKLPPVLVLCSHYASITGNCIENSNAPLEGLGWRQQDKDCSKIAALCAAQNAAVLGVDAVLGRQGLSCAWIVYVPGLVDSDRAALSVAWRS